MEQELYLVSTNTGEQFNEFKPALTTAQKYAGANPGVKYYIWKAVELIEGEIEVHSYPIGARD